MARREQRKRAQVTKIIWKASSSPLSEKHAASLSAAQSRSSIQQHLLPLCCLTPRYSQHYSLVQDFHRSGVTQIVRRDKNHTYLSVALTFPSCINTSQSFRIERSLAVTRCNTALVLNQTTHINHSHHQDKILCSESQHHGLRTIEASSRSR